MTTKLSLKERFDNNVFHSPDGCHYWTGATMNRGYGIIYFNNDTLFAHRVSYLLHIKDPGELCVCHHCDNRLCVNPDHFFLGTIADNNRDRHRKGRTIIPVRRGDLKLYWDKRLDLVGRRFTMLTVISLSKTIKYGRSWLCQCDCGETVEVVTTHLTLNRKRNCGCIRLRNKSEYLEDGSLRKYKKSNALI